MAKKIKILHVIEYFNVAGAENVVKSLVRGMRKYDCESEILVLNEKGLNGEELEKEGYKVYGLNWKSNKLKKNSIMSAIRAQVKKGNYDIVHAHNYTPWFFLILSSLFLNKKIMVTIHGQVDVRGKLLKRLSLFFLGSLTKKIILVSKEINVFPITLFDKSGKVKVVKNGVDFGEMQGKKNFSELRSELGIDERDFVILTVTRFYAIKNIEFQIRVLARLVKILPNVKFLIAARIIPYIDNIKKLAKDLNVEKQVLFLGLRKDVPVLNKISNIFMLSSFSEGTSLALLEAMVCGLIVVASRVGGNVGIINHGINGFLHEVNNIDEATDIILKIANKEIEIRGVAGNARVTVKDYSLDTMCCEYINLYKGFC